MALCPDIGLTQRTPSFAMATWAGKQSLARTGALLDFSIAERRVEIRFTTQSLVVRCRPAYRLQMQQLQQQIPDGSTVKTGTSCLPRPLATSARTTNCHCPPVRGRELTRHLCGKVPGHRETHLDPRSSGAVLAGMTHTFGQNPLHLVSFRKTLAAR